MADVDTLTRLWPQVREVAVKGGCAYVVAEDYLDPLHLRGLLARELPDADLPRHIVQVDSLDPADLVEPDDRFGAYLPPRDDTERVLVRIAERLLGMPKLGVLDDFYAAGGDSLAATGLAVEAQRALGVGVSSRRCCATRRWPVSPRRSAGPGRPCRCPAPRRRTPTRSPRNSAASSSPSPATPRR